MHILKSAVKLRNCLMFHEQKEKQSFNIYMDYTLEVFLDIHKLYNREKALFDKLIYKSNQNVLIN